MFPPTSNNLTQTHAHCPSGRRSRRAAASAFAAGAAALAILTGASNFANAAESSARIAQEQHACAVVMGLHRPGDLYDTCIRSLEKSLAELDQSRLASTDRGACAQEGLRPGTPAYAVCVVNAEQTPTDAASYREAVAVH
jgi:hypothetical protein